MTATFPDISEETIVVAAARRNEPEVGVACSELVHLHVVPTTLQARFDQQVIGRVRQDVYDGCKLLIRTLAMPILEAHTALLQERDADIITTRQRPYDIVMIMSDLLGEGGKLVESTISMMLLKYIEFFSIDPETKKVIGDMEEKLHKSARNAIILEVRAMTREIMEDVKNLLEKTATNVEVGRPALADAIQSSISRLLRIKNSGASLPSVTFLTAEGIYVHCNTDTMKISLREGKPRDVSGALDPVISGHIRLPLPIEWAPPTEVDIPLG